MPSGAQRQGVIPSILEETADATAALLGAIASEFPLLEIRADYLRASDLSSLLKRFPARSIVTVRGCEDGGFFTGSLEERREILERALGAGAAFVDVEWRGPNREWGLRSAPADRLILSDHGAEARTESLLALYHEMAEVRAARLKIVPRADTARDALAVRDLLSVARSDGRALASFALGSHGAFTRVFCVSWGSWGTYAPANRSRPTGDGQLPLRDLVHTYRASELDLDTRRFALAGRGVGASPSPALHQAAYRALGIRAVFVPVEIETLEHLLPLARGLGLEGLAVTIPLKEAVAQRCELADGVARASGAVNTVRLEPSGWRGFNTDGPAARDLIARHIPIEGTQVAILGSGGTARAIAAALAAAGAQVTLYGRTLSRLRAAADALHLSGRGMTELPSASWDVLVQATPLGREGEEALRRSAIRGKVVLDAAYGPTETPLVSSARALGLSVLDGFDLLVAQAERQIEILLGRAVRRSLLEHALDEWRRFRLDGPRRPE